MATNEQIVHELKPLALADYLARLQRFKPVVLASAGAHPEARHTYICMHPTRKVRLYPDGLYEWEGTWVRKPGDPLQALQRCFDETRADLPGFTGGWVGLICYEATQLIEPTLQTHALPYPLAEFWLMHDVIDVDANQLTLTHDDGRLDNYLAALDEVAALPPLRIEAQWHTSLQRDEFALAVKKLVQRIHDGDLFQANIATRFSTPHSPNPASLLLGLMENPSPFMALWPGDPVVVSGSPELLFATNGRTIRTRPIAGTRRRGKDTGEDDALAAELLADKKERAEHTMLVDLLRNDVAKIAIPGTIRVPEFMSVERYRNVMHLISRVEGTLTDGATVVDCLRATFPGGTITGAPKHRACMRIHESEPVPRGPYTGSIGYVGWNHDAEFNILIRTFAIHEGLHVHAGSGIVADSQPDAEWLEANHKASSFLEAVAGSMQGNVTRMGDVQEAGQWQPAPPRHSSGRVLLIDNYDSFSYNLRDYLVQAGAEVRVVRNDEPLEPHLDWATHAVIGPGPGWPAESGTTLELLSRWDNRPLLGVCLGHQAMGENVRAVSPVHGQASEVRHNGSFLAGLPNPLTVGRYHSLVCDAPADYDVIASLGEHVMAMQHKLKPWIGLQFHPESIITPQGGEILTRFLELA